MTDIVLYIAVAVIAVAVVLWMMRKSEKYANFRTLSTQYSNPLFSPCVSKRCAGGPYMFSSDPYMQAMCASMDPGCLSCKECTRAGYNGKPVQFEYSQLSNGCWGNSMCNTKPSSSLCVL